MFENEEEMLKSDKLISETDDPMVNTTKGMMAKADLEERRGQEEDDNEILKWVEYWYEGELVHRSVHVHLKKNVVAESIAAFMG